jgi:hypothetical protein
MRKWMMRGAVATTLAIAAGGAQAQQCQGFGDVLQSDTLVCPAVEWVKNRSVTLGCGDGSNYCPNNNVTRAQMALFMQRLGKALSPEVLGTQGGNDTPTVIPGEAGPAITNCVTSTLAAADYPRRAHINAMVSIQAPAGSSTSFRAFNLVVANGGAPELPQPGASAAARGTAPVNGWDTVSLTEAMNLAPDTSYVFFIGVRQDNFTDTGGTAARLRCQVTVSVTNRNGTSSPL